MQMVIMNPKRIINAVDTSLFAPHEIWLQGQGIQPAHYGYDGGLEFFSSLKGSPEKDLAPESGLLIP
jgi:hypothetical protein